MAMPIIKDLFYKEDFLLRQGFTIKNAIVDYVDINFVGHFNNSAQVILKMKEPNNPSIIEFPLLGCGQATVGWVLDGIMKVLDLVEENGIKLSELKDFPLRVVFDRYEPGGKIIAFGHLVQDQFVVIDELNRFGNSVIRAQREANK